MKKILFIGNNGSFFEDVKRRAVQLFDDCHFIELGQKKEYESLLSYLSAGYEIVVYIGGETRFEDKMNFLNYELPKKIFDMLLSSGLSFHFIYLSSLAVFGTSDDDTILTTSERNPVDYYGFTKQLLDEYTKANVSAKCKVSRIYPASILSGNGRSSVEKMAKIFKKWKFLKYIRFPGSLSYIERDKLIEIIFLSINSSESDKIASSEYLLKSQSKPYAIPVPKLPFFVFKLLSKIIGNKRSLYLRMIFRGIRYQ